MKTQLSVIPVKSLKEFPRILFYTLVFNTIIAVFLTSVGYGGGFATNFIMSQCIGITICLCILAALYLLKPTRPLTQLAAIMTAMIAGAVMGPVFGSIFAGIDHSILLFEQPGHIAKAVFLGILFGSIISYFFISREKISASEDLIQEERIKRLTSEKKAVESNLRLLQAQIEPHFLFNTLSNILSLMDTDLEKGKFMLEDLIHYLRASLSKTRGNTTTIGEEMETIRAYMNIFKVRMGDRLHYNIDCPDNIRNLPFPPMLIQPLVENAINHGLEPKVDGGKISVAVEEKDDVLRVKIADTGLGFHADSDPGIGISNIRERLQTLYADKARLILDENRPSGLNAIIEVPHGRDQGNHR